MGRTPNKAAAPADVTFNEPALQKLGEDAQLARSQDAALDEALAAGIDLGRLEALDFVATVANSAILAIYESVKKSKAWRLLRNPKSGHGDHFQSLEEFCEVKLGKSYRRLRALALNRNVLGEEAFEQAERLGLRQVDHDAIKALPAPEQEIVRQAVEGALSRDEVVNLIQELASRSAKTQEALHKQLDEAAQEHKATEKRLEVVTKQKEAAEAKAARIAVEPPDAALAELQKEATLKLADAQGAVRGGLRQALIALSHHVEDNTVFMASLVGQLRADLEALRQEFHLPDVSNAREAELAAKVARLAPLMKNKDRQG